MEITNAQRDKMLHAVGGVLDGGGHRNYYCAGEPDPDWEELVEAGLAARRDRGPELGGICYHVTVNGCNALRNYVRVVPVDRVRWLRSNAGIYRRRGGPSSTIADNLEACAQEMEEMREVLKAMAALKLTTEMSKSQLFFDHGARYDMLVEKAREVVGPLPQGDDHG